MSGPESIVLAHRFFSGLEADLAPVVAGFAHDRRFAAGDYLAHEGDAADTFFLIVEGKVALEILPPGQSPVVFVTEGQGDIVGTSWLVPPYRWRFDARAAEPTQAIGIDARSLRDKFATDPRLGYAMTRRMLPIIAGRLDETRLQLLDVYAKRGK